MHLLGYLVLVDVVVVGIAAAYVANCLILIKIYDRPDFPNCGWRTWLLWGIGLLIPISGVVVLALSAVATILAFVVVIARLILDAVARRSNPT